MTDDYDQSEFDSDQPDVASHPISDGHKPTSPRAADEDAHPADAADSPRASGPGSDLSADPLSAVHSSYLHHIRQLQKTNTGLTKKIDFLQAIQKDSTKMKLIKKLQKVLHEKQIIVDQLAEMVIAKGVMTPDALSTHLQQLIEHGALDQVNPAKNKKELLESRKECSRLMAELREAKRTIRAFEAQQSHSSDDKGDGSAGGGRPHTSRSRSDPNSHSVDTRADTLAAELLALTAAHTQLQSSHHALTLSIGEHKKLIETTTVENRSLRGYLTQWESSEERRILAEQQSLALANDKARWVQEQETLYQELRALKMRVQTLAASKADSESDAARTMSLSRHACEDAKDHAAALNTQLTLLKTDLKLAHEMAAWHRDQNIMHLPEGTKEAMNKREKEHRTQVEELEKQVDEWRNKCELALETKSESKSNASSMGDLLRENGRLLSLVSSLERELGSALIASDGAAAAASDAVASKAALTDEISVLQVALQQMAGDLQAITKQANERAATIHELRTVKIPKLRSQRQALADACQRQNVTIRELNREIEHCRHELDASRQQSSDPDDSHRTLTHRSASSSQRASTRSIATSQSHKSTRPASKTNSTAHIHAPLDSSHSSGKLVVGVASYDRAKPSSPSSSPIEQKYPTDSPLPSARELEAPLHEDDHAPPLNAINEAEPYSYTAIADEDGGAQPAPNASAGAEHATATVPAAEWHDPTGTWSRYPTEDGQAWFYYNNHTMESVWTDPLLDAAMAVVDTAQAVADSAAALASSSASAVASKLDSLGSFVSPSSVGVSVSVGGPVSVSAGLSLASDRSIHSADLHLTPLQSERFALPELSYRNTHAHTHTDRQSATSAEDEFPTEDEVGL